MTLKKIVAALLATALCFSAFAGCSTSNSDTSSSSSSTNADDTDVDDGTMPTLEAGTIKIMTRGDKTDGWDSVYEGFLEATADTLNTELNINFITNADYKDKLNLEITSGEAYDLVFEATWLQLKTLSADGYYADLSHYYGNPTYEGLYESFPIEVMESNIYYDYMCYIPVYESFGNGVGCVWYRQDWSDEWGIGEIESYDDLEAYWDAAKAAGYYAYGGTSSRGFYQMYTVGGEMYETGTGDSYTNTAQAGLQRFDIGTQGIWAYIKDAQVVSIAVEGAGDEAFADFPEGWNYDFTVDRYQKFADWQAAGYIDPDSMNVTDSTIPFDAEIYASYTGTVGTYSTDETRFYSTNTDPDAELGYFVYSIGASEQLEASIPTSYAVNNGYCVPANSDELERVMQFFNWMHSSADNQNLFAYGIEGVDWEAVGDDKYTPITSYSTTFPGYQLTYSPIYKRYTESFPEEIIEIEKWQKETSTYVVYEAAGFSFDSTSTEMSTYLAMVTGVADMYASMSHGILTNGVTSFDTAEEMRSAKYEEQMANGLDKIVAELEVQLQDYLDEKYA